MRDMKEPRDPLEILKRIEREQTEMFGGRENEFQRSVENAYDVGRDVSTEVYAIYEDGGYEAAVSELEKLSEGE